MGDERLRAEIVRVHKANLGVYGVRKVWRALNREGFPVDAVGVVHQAGHVAGVAGSGPQALLRLTLV